MASANDDWAQAHEDVLTKITELAHAERREVEYETARTEVASSGGPDETGDDEAPRQVRGVSTPRRKSRARGPQQPASPRRRRTAAANDDDDHSRQASEERGEVATASAETESEGEAR